MAIVTAPLLSFGASGQIAKSMVFGTWKGIPYSRRYVIPANPRSTEQTLTRSVFSYLNNVFKVAPAGFRLAWTRYAIGKPMTDRNAFVKFNNGLLREATDLDGMIMSPGAFGGLAAPFVATPGDDLITVTASAPDPLPPGWTVTRFIAAAIKDGDPHELTDYDVVSGQDLTAAYSVVLAGLESATTYAVAGWFEFQRSALPTDLAYGPANAVLRLTT